MSPLLVKVWRMYRIVGASSGFRRKAVSHYQAAIMTLPIIAVEILLLIVFSFVDPSRLGESLEVTDGYATKYLSCEQDSQLFFGIQTAYHCTYLLFDFEPHCSESNSQKISRVHFLEHCF